MRQAGHSTPPPWGCLPWIRTACTLARHLPPGSAPYLSHAASAHHPRYVVPPTSALVSPVLWHPESPPPCLSLNPPVAFKHTQACAHACTCTHIHTRTALPRASFLHPASPHLFPSSSLRHSSVPAPPPPNQPQHPHLQVLTRAQEWERAVQTQLVWLGGEQGCPGPWLSQARGKEQGLQGLEREAAPLRLATLSPGG